MSKKSSLRSQATDGAASAKKSGPRKRSMLWAILIAASMGCGGIAAAYLPVTEIYFRANEITDANMPLIRLSAQMQIDQLRQHHDLIQVLRIAETGGDPSKKEKAWQQSVMQYRESTQAFNRTLAAVTKLENAAARAWADHLSLTEELSALVRAHDRLEADFHSLERLVEEQRMGDARKMGELVLTDFQRVEQRIEQLGIRARASAVDSADLIQWHASMVLWTAIVLATLCGTFLLWLLVSRSHKNRPTTHEASPPATKNKPKSTAQPSLLSTQVVDLQGSRVLLAEDGPLNQKMISRILTKAGAKMTLADEGREAMGQFDQAIQSGTPFDLILLDIHMPIMDGLQAIGELRRAGFTGPIIAVTADASEENVTACQEAGFDDLVIKPIDRTRLLVVVTGQLERHRKQAPA